MSMTVKQEFFSKIFTVDSEHSAKAVGSGTLPVLSSPSMIAFMENTALEQMGLPEGETTVGCYLAVNHVRPTAIGKKVEIHSKILKTEGKFITFEIDAFSDGKKIGACTHRRVVVKIKSFLEKIKS